MIAGGRATEAGSESTAEERVDGDDEDWFEVVGGSGGSGDSLGEDEAGAMSVGIAGSQAQACKWIMSVINPR